MITMANNLNNNAVSHGNLYVLDGVECVRWAINSFKHENFTLARFEELSGNPASFLKEWAINRYPLLCNGWLFEPVASHVQDADGVYAVTFVVNNAVVPDLGNTTYGMMTIASENGVVSCDITNIRQS